MVRGRMVGREQELAQAQALWHRPSMNELGIPQSVRLAIQARLTKLPPDTQEVLRLAAIGGREFHFEILAAATSLDEGALIDVLEAAEGAQRVEEVARRSDGTFRFAHALIPTTLTESLSGIRRRRMHHQVLDALQQLRPGDFESLAHHALEAEGGSQ
jgi:predicted ATPase